FFEKNMRTPVASFARQTSRRSDHVTWAARQSINSVPRLALRISQAHCDVTEIRSEVTVLLGPQAVAQQQQDARRGRCWWCHCWRVSPTASRCWRSRSLLQTHAAPTVLGHYCDTCCKMP